MEQANLYAAWIGILLGMVAGAVQGLFFHREDWLGGYATWTRRMMRLGHISLFGLAFVNLAFALSVRSFGLSHVSIWSSRLLIIGAVTMPLVCYLSAARKSFRHLFPIPVVSLLAGVLWFLLSGLRP